VGPDAARGFTGCSWFAYQTKDDKGVWYMGGSLDVRKYLAKRRHNNINVNIKYIR
jgi:hypothetical protein